MWDYCCICAGVDYYYIGYVAFPGENLISRDVVSF